MKHVDVWHDITQQNVSLALIIEDDAIFVPFFKEKLTRMIHSAVNKGFLRLNGSCIESKTNKQISNDERINQNAMIVMGTCLNIHSQCFERDKLESIPMFSTHKSSSSRCSHAYLLTSCSAKSLIEQIHSQPNNFLPLDHLLNHLVALSPTLQSFWLDPPLVYQGNQVIDLDHVQTFRIQTYKKKK